MALATAESIAPTARANQAFPRMSHSPAHTIGGEWSSWIARRSSFAVEKFGFLTAVRIRPAPRDRIRTPMCWSLSAVRRGWSTPVRATTNPACKSRSFSCDDRTVCVGADKSEHCRTFKAMNFHFAHRSSNPIWPATQSVSNGGITRLNQ